MSVAVVYLLTTAVTLIVVLTLGFNLMGGFDRTTDSLVTLQGRLNMDFETKINGPRDQSINETLAANVTVANTGNVPLAQFADWDMIIETREEPWVTVRYLTYSTSTTPGVNQWTVDAIYLDAASSTPEILEPGVLDPDEEMVVLANPHPAPGGSTYARATFATPNGITASFQVFWARWMYVLDRDDLTVYRYLDDGTFLDSDPLDGQNSDAMGITATTTNFWTTDEVDDLLYKYTTGFALSATSTLESSNVKGAGVTTDGNHIWTVDSQTKEVFKYDVDGGFVSKFGLAAKNRDPTGIATDGAYIWVTDEKDDKVYKYDMAGSYDSSFSLDAANLDATGITTDGSAIWVLDQVDATVYRYDMDGTLVSQFSLTGSNADPQGITVRPR